MEVRCSMRSVRGGVHIDYTMVVWFCDAEGRPNQLTDLPCQSITYTITQQTHAVMTGNKQGKC